MLNVGNIKRPRRLGYVFLVAFMLCATFLSLTASNFIDVLRPYLLSSNILENGSFEDGLKFWRLDRKKVITPEWGARAAARFDYDPALFDAPFEFEYFPESIPIDVAANQLAKALLAFEIFNRNGKQLGKLTYVLSGEEDYWSYQNQLVSGIPFLVTRKRTEVGKWNKIRIESPLKDYNALAVKINSAPIKVEDVGGVGFRLEKWTSTGTDNIEVVFRNLPDTLHAAWLGESQDCLSKTRTVDCIKASRTQASIGKNFLRFEGNRALAARSTQLQLKEGAWYLLSADVRSEEGVIAPAISAETCDGQRITSRKTDLNGAQIGWVHTMAVFRATSDCLAIVLDRSWPQKSKLYYVNHYDNIRLKQIKASALMNEAVAVSLVGWSLNIEPNKDNLFPLSPLPLDVYADQDFVDQLARDIDDTGLHSLNLELDEAEFWHAATSNADGNPAPYYQHAFASGGYKTMFPAVLEADGKKQSIRIKTRGVGDFHRAARNKSYRINFSKNNRIDLLRPCTRGYVSEAFSASLARDLGLFTIKNDFVFLSINGKPIGVSYRISRGKENFERNKKPEGYLITLRDFADYIQVKNLENWRAMAKPSDKNFRVRYPHEDLVAQTLQFAINADAEKLEHLLDVNKLVLWDAHSRLLESNHQDYFHNALFYWDTVRGMMEYVPWDTGMADVIRPEDPTRHYGSSTRFLDHANPLADHFLKKINWFNYRNRILHAVVSQPGQIERLLATYDQIAEGAMRGIEKSTNFLCDHGTSTYYPVIPVSEIKQKINSNRRALEVRAERLNVYLSAKNTYKAQYKKSLVQNSDSGRRQQWARYDFNVVPEQNDYIASTEILGLEVNPLFLKRGGSIEINGRKAAITTYNNKHIIPINQLLASKAYMDYCSQHLWRMEYDLAKKNLAADPKGMALLTENLEPGAIKFGNPPFFTLKEAKWKKEPYRTQWIDLLRKAKVINAPSQFTFSAILPANVSFVPEDNLQVVLRQAITGEFIPVKFEEADVGVTNLTNNTAEIIPTMIRSSGQTKALMTDEMQSVFDDLAGPFRSRSDFLKTYEVFRPGLKPNQVVLPSGDAVIAKTVIVPRGIELTIMPGANVQLGAGVSIISYGKVFAIGQPNNPIAFQPADAEEPWGVFALLRAGSGGTFKDVYMQGGSGGRFNGIIFSGMLSAHYADLSVENALFENANQKGGDDAVNVKYGKATIKNSIFYKNAFDGLDLDFVDADSRIENTIFYGNGNDGLDISGSEIFISKVLVDHSGDKGISLGEKAHGMISESVFRNSHFGVASKDSSQAIISDSLIEQNHIGIAAYRKKDTFLGGTVRLQNSVVKSNKMDLGVDEYVPVNVHRAHIFVENSYFKPSGLKLNEVIKEPSKQVRSKKKLLVAYANGDLDTYGTKIIRLTDDCCITAGVPRQNDAWSGHPIRVDLSWLHKIKSGYEKMQREAGY